MERGVFEESTHEVVFCFCCVLFMTSDDKELFHVRNKDHTPSYYDCHLLTMLSCPQFKLGGGGQGGPRVSAAHPRASRLTRTWFALDATAGVL